eukprot:tig00021122_g18446.t1
MRPIADDELELAAHFESFERVPIGFPDLAPLRMSFLKKLGLGSSHLEDRIDLCTSDMLLAPDWPANLEVTDLINGSEKGPREAMKALRKKIRDRNPKVAVLALTLVETCMKNCGTRFHVQIADEEFMEELVKVATGRRGGEAEEKALQLVRAWGEAFRERREDPVLGAFYRAYAEMRSRGITFPPAEGDAMAVPRRSQRAEMDLTAGEAAAIRVAGGGAPAATDDFMDELDDWRSNSPTRRGRAARSSRSVRTAGYSEAPQRSEAVSDAAYAEYLGRSGSAAPRRSAAPAPRPQPAAAARAQAAPVLEVNRQKLEGDLEVVRTNCELLSEIVAACDPQRELITENPIANELHESCTAMSMRVMELLEELSGQPDMDEVLLAQLLAVNDDLQRVFTAYENARVEGMQRQQAPQQAAQQRSSRSADAPLIDLQGPDSVSASLAAMNLQGRPPAAYTTPALADEEEEAPLRGRPPSHSPAAIPPPPPPQAFLADADGFAPHLAAPAPGVRPATQEGWDFSAPAPAAASDFGGNPFAGPPPPPGTEPVNVDDFDAFLNASRTSNAPLPGATTVDRADMEEFDRFLAGNAVPQTHTR